MRLAPFFFRIHSGEDKTRSGFLNIYLIFTTVVLSHHVSNSLPYGYKYNTVKPVVSGHSTIELKTKVLKTNVSLMRFESIAECSPILLTCI